MIAVRRQETVASKFVTKSKAYAFVINQGDEQRFVCDPHTTFGIEEEGTQIHLCKYIDSPHAEETQGDKVSSSKRNHTMKKYSVDGCTLSTNDVNMRQYLAQFEPILDKVLSLAVEVGVSSSVWLLGGHSSSSSQLNSSLLFGELRDADLFQHILEALFSRLGSPSSQLQEHLRLSWRVEIKCFEVFGDQIVDLFVPQDSERDTRREKKGESGIGSGGSPHPPKVREHPQHGPVLVGLTHHSFSSADDAYSALRLCFSRRLLLIAETSVSGSRSFFGQRVLGAVGNVFVQMKVTQVLYPAEVAMRSGSFDSSTSFESSSTVQFNVLADIDAVSFKPSKQDTVNILSVRDFLQDGVSRTTDTDSHDGRPKNIASSSLLASSHKSLSSLSRVLRLLSKQESVLVGKEEDGTSSPQPMTQQQQQQQQQPIFIPYRDSVLTRVLQPSLSPEGNYVNFVYLCISCESSASTEHGLRMTMELRGRLQHIERHKIIVDESSAALASAAKTSSSRCPEVARRVVGRKWDGVASNRIKGGKEEVIRSFVGQGMRQQVKAMAPSLTDLGMKREEGGSGAEVIAGVSSGGEDMRGPEPEERLSGPSAEIVEHTFWETLARLQEGRSSFIKQLEDLESQRCELFKGLDLEVVAVRDAAALTGGQRGEGHEPTSESSGVQISVSSLCNGPTALSVEVTEVTGRKESGRRNSERGSKSKSGVSEENQTEIKKAGVVVAPASSSDCEPPQGVVEDQGGGLGAPGFQPDSSGALRWEGQFSPTTHHPHPHPHQYASLRPLALPQPLPFSGSFPTSHTEVGTDTNTNTNTNTKASTNPNITLLAATAEPSSQYDHVDFAQLPLSADRQHFSDPSGFMDLCESLNQVSSGRSEPQDQAQTQAPGAPLLQLSTMTGRNIWGTPPRHEGEKEQRREHGRAHGSSQGRSCLSPKKLVSTLPPEPLLNTTAASEVLRSDVPPSPASLSLIGTNNLHLPPLPSNPSTPMKELQQARTHSQGSEVKDISPMRVSITKRHDFSSGRGHVVRSSSLNEFGGDLERGAGQGDEETLSPLDNSFLQAVSHSNLSKVKSHVSRGADVNVKNSFQRDAMQIAVRNGDLDIVQFLCDHGASTATRGRRGDTLFHIAARHGHVPVLQWLAAGRGAGGGMCTLLDMHGQSAAHVAARRGEVGVLVWLREELGMARMLAEEDFEGLTPLQCVPRSVLGSAEGAAACREYLLSVLEHH